MVKNNVRWNNFFILGRDWSNSLKYNKKGKVKEMIENG
jgi:hypothetical protein